MKFYLAGKISKHDWRGAIVAGFLQGDYERYNQLFNYGGQATGGLPWKVMRGAIFGKHDYVGPYFVGCDHGCFHGRTDHGYGLTGTSCAGGHPIGRRELHQACLEAIDKADVVFCHLESIDAFGTFIEVGYAAGKGIPVWLSIAEGAYQESDVPWEYAFHGHPHSSELWFLIETAEKVYVGDRPPAETLSEFLKPESKKQSYLAYLKSDHWKATRAAAIERAEGHCQFCNATERLEVHHRTYERLGAEEPGDLIVLCHDCHTTLHGVESGRPTRMPVRTK